MTINYRLFKEEVVKLLNDYIQNEKMGDEEIDRQINIIWSQVQNHCPFCHERLDPIKKPVMDHYTFDKGTRCWAHKICLDTFVGGEG